MRIDKFLNTVNITKRRAISEDMCKSGVISINDKPAKPSKEVKVGDKITIKFLAREVCYMVIALPTLKTIPKSEQEKYVKEI
ncbi:RNA-binding S4 domain-containing protein [Campylobacter fetus]|uniref:RNA-binding S4 domain-containing protein n=1 Tax=Campylobacter fetus subsp. testudinum TaxID=1507806 RepID=A0AAX0HBS5_CAMFE|nr:RNA-binding S4 domain-containing protein [Campylobacter fetus]AGZ81713.1 ribosome-associated heat shock protein (S4 domain) [Campylobacter fetus subsp. testudinum 03-427]AJB45451.1 hypothetical protein CR44_04305 [Campylobacter fetus subsp. testudinum]ALV64870.1 ribosome-associated heat shock protein (S4 domain) [Campylobacter fetus subsp. testudinum Sp3]AVK81116.1 RNA-binding S4 domain-containing protein [Campylobacter fetus subsp. testudinum]EAI4321309.1 RNA-binding S4 domain-containing p